MLEAHKSAAITELQLELVALREKELNFFVWHYSALLIVSGVFLFFIRIFNVSCLVTFLRCSLG